jgi:exopolysaccharide biosynthesis protein
VYSECSGEWSQALVVSTEGHASIEDCADLSREVLANADDAMGSNERIVRDGENTATWRELHPRTAIGVTGDEELVLVVVDGRQRGYSEGMTTPEVAEVMLDFGVVDAINLDGGGSTTLVINRGEPLVINRPVGRRRAGTLREVGSSFGVFAGPNR